MDPIGSTNQRIKRLRRLVGRRSSRLDEGAFVIEGPTLVADAIAAGVDIEVIFVDAERMDLLAALGADGAAVVVVQAGVLQSVLSAVSPQPICAVAALSPGADLEQLAARSRSAERPLLVLCDIADPGNAGTLLRAAEASGCVGVVMLGDAVDVFSPKVVRSSAGSVFRVPIASESDPVGALARLGELGVETIAAIARGGITHFTAPLDGSVAIVVGNEAHGLSDQQVGACGSTVTIVMDGASESLNVAMAGTVLCFEALRQRHR